MSGKVNSFQNRFNDVHSAGEQGFEPRSATLKAAVLPLNHSPWWSIPIGAIYIRNTPSVAIESGIKPYLVSVK